jgi:hypothetical protein
MGTTTPGRLASRWQRGHPRRGSLPRPRPRSPKNPPLPVSGIIFSCPRPRPRLSSRGPDRGGRRRVGVGGAEEDGEEEDAREGEEEGQRGAHPPRALLPPALERRPPPHRTANPRALPRCSRSPAGRAGREAPGSGTSCVDSARLRRARLRRFCRRHRSSLAR